jgi:flagellar biosynthesis/type III secretory pathway M-ring protein FliF/YscJ
LPVGYQPLELEAGGGFNDDDDLTMALPAAVREMPAFPNQASLTGEVAQIGQMIEQEPERIAEMLRAWLESVPGER